LVKTSKIIKSNHQSNITMPAKSMADSHWSILLLKDYAVEGAHTKAALELNDPH